MRATIRRKKAAITKLQAEINKEQQQIKDYETTLEHFVRRTVRYKKLRSGGGNWLMTENSIVRKNGEITPQKEGTIDPENGKVLLVKPENEGF